MEQCFVLTGIDIYSGYGFAFSLHDASAQITIHGLTWSHPWTYTMLIHHQGISHSMASHHRTHCTAKEVWQWAYTHGTYWSYHVPYHPEAAGLTEQWHSL